MPNKQLRNAGIVVMIVGFLMAVFLPGVAVEFGGGEGIQFRSQSAIISEPVNVIFKTTNGPVSGVFSKIRWIISDLDTFITLRLDNFEEGKKRIESSIEIRIENEPSALSNKLQSSHVKFKSGAIDVSTGDFSKSIGLTTRWEGKFFYNYEIVRDGVTISSAKVFPNQAVGTINAFNNDIFLESLGFLNTGYFPSDTDFAVVDDGLTNTQFLVRQSTLNLEVARWNLDLMNAGSGDGLLIISCGNLEKVPYGNRCRYVNMAEKDDNPAPREFTTWKDAFYGVIVYVGQSGADVDYTDVTGDKWAERGRAYGIGYSSGFLLDPSKGAPTLASLGATNIEFLDFPATQVWLDMEKGVVGNFDFIVWVRDNIDGFRVVDISETVLIPDIEIVVAEFIPSRITEGGAGDVRVVIKNTGDLNAENVRLTVSVNSVITSPVIIDVASGASREFFIPFQAQGVSGNRQVTGELIASCGLCITQKASLSLNIIDIPDVTAPPTTSPPGVTPPPATAPPTPDPVVDSDGDGIQDKFDHCPKIYGPIDNNGCPLGEESEPTSIPVGLFFMGAGFLGAAYAEKVKA